MRVRLGLLVVTGLLAGTALGLDGATAQTPPQDGPPICGSEAGAGAEAADDGVLRVASYNILHTQGDYDDETQSRRIDLVADAMADADVDIAGMQEVVSSQKHGVVAQRMAAAMADRTGDTWAWCFFQSNPHLPLEPDTGPGGIGGPVSQQIAAVARAGDSPWSEGVAIIARFPIVDQQAHRLVNRIPEAPVCQVADPTNPLAIPTCTVDTRQVLWARVQTSCGPVDMFSSHLANNESPVTELIRILQINDALLQIDQLATADEAPDFYTGDFNTLEGGPVWQAVIDAGFVDGYREAEPDAAGFTSGQDIADPEPTVEHRIDYVFARAGSEAATPADGEILGDQPVPFDGSEGETVVWPSDHYGVAVSFPFAQACTAETEPTEPPSPSRMPDDDGAPPGGGPSLPATGGTDAALPVGLAGLAVALSLAGLRRRVRRMSAVA